MYSIIEEWRSECDSGFKVTYFKHKIHAIRHFDDLNNEFINNPFITYDVELIESYFREYYQDGDYYNNHYIVRMEEIKFED